MTSRIYEICQEGYNGFSAHHISTHLSSNVGQIRVFGSALCSINVEFVNAGSEEDHIGRWVLTNSWQFRTWRSSSISAIRLISVFTTPLESRDEETCCSNVGLKDFTLFRMVPAA